MIPLLCYIVGVIIVATTLLFDLVTKKNELVDSGASFKP